MTGWSASLVALAEVVSVNALLSGDNALVIAMACRNLAPRDRTKGMVIGTVVAIVLRVALTLFVTELLQIPLVKLIGGVVLLWIAVKLVVSDDSIEESIGSSRSLLHAVRTVVVADVAMSIDNVLAISAIARGDIVILILGLGISIPFIVAGAALLMALINRFPVLVWAGAGLLGWVASAMMVDDAMVVRYLGQIDERAAGAVGALVVLGIAGLLTMRAKRD